MDAQRDALVTLFSKKMVFDMVQQHALAKDNEPLFAMLCGGAGVGKTRVHPSVHKIVPDMTLSGHSRTTGIVAIPSESVWHDWNEQQNCFWPNSSL